MIYCNEIEQTLFAPLPQFLRKDNEGNFFVYNLEGDDADNHKTSEDTSSHPMYHSLTQDDKVSTSYWLLAREAYSRAEDVSQKSSNGGQIKALFSRSDSSPCNSRILSPTTSANNRITSPMSLPWLLRPNHSQSNLRKTSCSCFFFQSKQRPKPSKHRIDRRELYHHLSESKSDSGSLSDNSEQHSPVWKRYKEEKMISNSTMNPLCSTCPPNNKTARPVLCFLSSPLLET
ncbi:hypothetical protein IV203_032314 [Nitzschia inconspicua]|uniref:Uncharacterized protein n=1 Tax=Nitzschia inconspicua TaxID=303405 RepID=A0A9K3KJF0_9STRA|nr:hypothetical protein IV203_032314 [Nitzschia inconspicua]